MSSYHPDHWSIVQFEHNGKTHYKVLADWSGSYLYGASWKLSSGITSIVEEVNQYVITNHSGSVYYCRKGGDGLGLMGASVLANLQEKFGDAVKVVSVTSVKLD